MEKESLDGKKADYTLLFARSGVRRYTFDNLPLGVTGNPSLQEEQE